MNVRAHKTNIVLFPLCDKSGLMLQALQPSSQSNLQPSQLGGGSDSADFNSQREGTRPDAVVFAWILDLPLGIEPVHAARALLEATKHQVALYNPYQLSILKELNKLIEQENTRDSAKNFLLTKVRQSKYRGSKKSLSDRQIRISPDAERRNFVCLSGGLERGGQPSCTK